MMNILLFVQSTIIGKLNAGKLPIIEVFVSHRCDEFHNSNIQQITELLLRNFHLTPRYGCPLSETNTKGSPSEHITKAAKESPCYLAVVQDSWIQPISGIHPLDTMQLNEEILPPRPREEFAQWRKYHRTSQNFIAFLINEVSRRPFLDDVQCYNISTIKTEKFTTSLMEDDSNTFWATSRDTDCIKHALKDFIPEIMRPIFQQKEIQNVLTDEIIKMKPDEEWHKNFELKKGSAITITCVSNMNFYTGFFHRDEYIKNRKAGILGTFNFEFGGDRPQYTKKMVIPEDDDYYLVIRVGVFSGNAEIHVKVKCLNP